MCQGLCVSAALLGLLIVVVFVFGVPPGTTKAVFADAVLGLLIAVFGVWVVGGTIELKTSLYDIGIKASGGIAILLLATFYVRPFYYALGYSDYAEDIVLSPWDTVATIITHYQGQFRRSEDNAIHVVIPDAIQEKVLRFRADQPGFQAIYQANWGGPPRNPRLRVLDQIAERQDCLSFVEKGDRVVAQLRDTDLKICEELCKDASSDGPIYLCERKG